MAYTVADEIFEKSFFINDHGLIDQKQWFYENFRSQQNKINIKGTLMLLEGTSKIENI